MPRTPTQGARGPLAPNLLMPATALPAHPPAQILPPLHCHRRATGLGKGLSRETCRSQFTGCPCSCSLGTLRPKGHGSFSCCVHFQPSPHRSPQEPHSPSAAQGTYVTAAGGAQDTKHSLLTSALTPALVANLNPLH